MTSIEDFRYLRFLTLAALLGLLLIMAGGAGPGAQRAEAQTANGLKAEYFDNADLTNPKLSRTDPNVNFSWGKGSPATGVGADTFSARWTGQVEASAAGEYVFYTSTTDGARLWVDGRLVIDKWIAQNKAKEWSGRAQLSAGRHDIKMEYYEDAAVASARLSWSGPGIKKQVIPQSRLFLPAAPPPPAPQCSDGQDNDNDGKVDHPADPGCESATDGSESPDPAPPPDDAQRWSAPATWGGQAPQAGQTITIPSGKTVLLDQSTPHLGGLQVDGTLLFEDKDLALTSDWVMVHGKLQVGTQAAPFLGRARIVLTGSDPNQNISNMGPKVLGVMGGTLEVHGEPRKTWTRLAATAPVGANTLTLDGAPGWRVGDRIVVASTDYDPLQAEEATITAVSGNIVTLDKTLRYAHWGTVQTFDGRPVDERAEVALLSRNVTIEGEEATSANGFGGQIMAMNMTGAMARDATLKIENAELTRMGQKNVLRRYPVHFHMLGDAGANSYLKNTSLHKTFNRCVTIHGTNKLDVSGNVCHDHIGHGYFFEDGAEVDNVLEGNLGLVTRRPPQGERLLPSDESPATYWITNPDNVVRNNAAAGSQGKGFWLAYPKHPTGLSKNANVWPRRTPLGEFSGNASHSNDSDGLHVDGGPNEQSLEPETTYYDPHQNPADANSPTVAATFGAYTGYKNRDGAIWLRGENHRVVNATLADNARGATFASHESYLQDSLAVGETANKGTPRSWEVKGLDGRSLPRPWDAESAAFPIRGFEFYDGLVGAERTTFVNFTPNTQRQASGLGVLLADAFTLHPRNFATALRFVNANRVYMPDPVPGMDGDNSAVFVDTDGSVTGTAGRAVAANNPFLLDGTCTLRSEWNAHVCRTEYVSLWAGTGDGDPNDIKPVTLTRTDGKVQTLMGCCDDSTDAISNLFPDQKYTVGYNGGTPSRLRFVLWNGATRYLRLDVAYPVEPLVTKYGCDLADTDQWNWCKGKATSLAALESATKSSYYYDAAAKKLHLKLVAGDENWEELEVAPR